MSASRTDLGQASRLPGSHLLGLGHFEVWRPRVIALLIFTAALLVAYWVVWTTDRGIVASNHTAQYIAFEQSFPLADGWLLTAALIAALQLSRRRPSALLWLLVLGAERAFIYARWMCSTTCSTASTLGATVVRSSSRSTSSPRC